MNYEATVRDTDRLVREIMHREQVWLYVLMGLAAVFAALAVMMAVFEIKDRRERRRNHVVGGYRYAPNVTDVVQVKDGMVYHKMGVPKR